MNKIFILPLSAKSDTSLKQYQLSLANSLKGKPDASLANISYTLREKREFFQYRNCIAGKNIGDVIHKLSKLDKRAVSIKQIAEISNNLIFTFPGQGSQYAGMGSFLYENEKIFKSTIDQCCEIFACQQAIEIKPILLSAHQKINETQWAQPLLFMVSYALAKLFESWNIKPVAYIGHSIGEYVAATLSNVFSLEDAIHAVTMRGRLMQSMPTGSMLAIQRNAAEIADSIKHLCEIAVINSPDYCVASGSTEDISQLKKLLDEKKIATSLLHTSHAFHSRMMDKAAEAFTAYLGNIKLKAPTTPFISNLTGQFITAAEATSSSYWGQHIRNCVQFSLGIETLFNTYDHPLFLELGPGNALTTFVKQHTPTHNPLAFNTLLSAKEFKAAANPEDDIKLYETIGDLWRYGYPVDFSLVANTIGAKTVALPSYQFEKKRCWVDRPIDKRKAVTPNVQHTINPILMPKKPIQTTQILTDDDTTKFEEAIALLFHNILGVSGFSKHDNFFDLGGTSLSSLKLIGELKALQISISIAEIVKYNSVFSLSSLKAKLACRDKIIIPLKTHLTAQKNVFLIHPVGGTLVLYRNLVKDLDPSYNYYGIQNIHIDNGALVEADSLENLAQIYIAEILKIQPEGSYKLMGSSLGGTLAYEMARQLQNLGKQIDFISMFDSWAIFSEDKHDQTVFKKHMYAQMKSEFADYTHSLSELGLSHSELVKNLCEARWKLMTLLLNYSIPKCNSKMNIHLFKAKKLDVNHIANGHVPDNGWQKFTGFPIHTHLVEGDHSTLIEQPGLSKIITVLNTLLAKKQKITDFSRKQKASSFGASMHSQVG